MCCSCWNSLTEHGHHAAHLTFPKFVMSALPRTPSAWCAITAHQTHSTNGKIRAGSAGLQQTQPLLSCLLDCPGVWVTGSQIKHAWGDQEAAVPEPEVCQISPELCAEQKPNRLHPAHTLQCTVQLCLTKSSGINLSH